MLRSIWLVTAGHSDFVKYPQHDNVHVIDRWRRWGHRRHFYRPPRRAAPDDPELLRDALEPELEPEPDPEDPFPAYDDPPRDAPELYDPPPEDAGGDGALMTAGGGGGGAEFMMPTFAAGRERDVCIGWFDVVNG